MAYNYQFLIFKKSYPYFIILINFESSSAAQSHHTENPYLWSSEVPSQPVVRKLCGMQSHCEQCPEKIYKISLSLYLFYQIFVKLSHNLIFGIFNYFGIFKLSPCSKTFKSHNSNICMQT